MHQSVQCVPLLTIVLLLKTADNSPITAFNASEIDTAENEVEDVPCLFGKLNCDERLGNSDGLIGSNLQEPTSSTFSDGTTSTPKRDASDDDAQEIKVAHDARGYIKRASKVIAPLVLGFLMAGVLMGSVAAVKLFLVKSLLLSQLALGAAMALAAKSLLSTLGAGGGGGGHYPSQPYLHHLHPLHLPLPEISPYHHNPYAADHHFPPPVEAYPDYGYHAVGGRSPGEASVEQEDLQAHYSNQVEATAAPASSGTRNATSRMDELSVPSGGITLVKSQSHHAPIVVYRKAVSIGRAAVS